MNDAHKRNPICQQSPVNSQQSPVKSNGPWSWTMPIKGSRFVNSHQSPVNQSTSQPVNSHWSMAICALLMRKTAPGGHFLWHLQTADLEYWHYFYLEVHRKMASTEASAQVGGGGFPSLPVASFTSLTATGRTLSLQYSIVPFPFLLTRPLNFTHRLQVYKYWHLE